MSREDWAPERVSAKIKVTGRTAVSDDQVMVTFGPDYEDGRNKEWAKYTPAFSLTMTVLKEIAVRHFPEGRAFGLVFTPEDGPGPADGENPGEKV